MSRTSLDKSGNDHLDSYNEKELGGDVDRHLQVQLPESLQGLSEEEIAKIDKEATRKLDILLMPILVILYILNYLDRQNIASAKIANIHVDLNLSTTQYNTAVAVLFAGYVALQIPSNMVASKISVPGIYICGMCVAWGMVSACTGAVHSFAGLAICRVVLGFTEAAFFPGAIFLLSIFYEKKRMALRTAILYSGSQVGNAFGGLFALAILQLEGAHGLEGWRWLFIVEGVMTVGLGIIFAFIIPNRPETIKWLTSQERDQLNYRLQLDRGSKDATDEVGVGRAFIMAVTDVKTWLLCGCLQMCYIAASVTNFFPIVVQGLLFPRTTTLAITAPPYILCVIAITINGWHSDKKQERALHIICPFFFTIIGNVIAISTTAIAPRNFAMCILPASFYSAAIVILSWISSSMTGPHVKRAVVYALINSLCNTPNIWTSYLYKDAPRFVLAFAVDLAAAVGLVFFAAATWWYLRRQNRRIEAGVDLGTSGPTKLQIENGFRYQL